MVFQHVVIVGNYWEAIFFVVNIATSLFLAPLYRKANPLRKI